MDRRVIGLIAAALFAADGAAQTTSGTRGRSFTPAAAPSVAPTTSVRSLYVLHCSGCHGLDGAGSDVGGVPDMRRLGLFLRLEGGREFIVKVPGVMNAGLSDRQIAEVTNWVLANLAPDSVPVQHRRYDAAEIARARQNPLVDVAAARAGLIAQARRMGLDLQ